MRIGVYSASRSSQGIEIFCENILAKLEDLGIHIVPFHDLYSLPNDVDLIWDPGVPAASKPFGGQYAFEKPSLATLWGVLSFTIPAHERHTEISAQIWDRVKNANKRRIWRHVSDKISAVITGSEFVRGEAIKHLGLPPEKVSAIWAGVDHAIYRPPDSDVSPPAYLLHISNGLPTKNVSRILSAYARLPASTRPPLKLRVSGQNFTSLPQGVEVIKDRLHVTELVRLYQESLVTIFPSLHEGFGLPIVEAMACGCPVITSNVTACPEVAGDAALLVNPRDTDEITMAMQRLIDDSALRDDLRTRGLKRAALFTWERSAALYYQQFERIINGQQG